MDFLRQDAAGEFYWDDEFIFSIDPSATLSSNRSVLWEQMDLKLQSGAFGQLGVNETMLLYWTLMEDLDYPYAGEIKAAVQMRIDEQKAQQAAMQQMQMGGMGNVMP